MVHSGSKYIESPRLKACNPRGSRRLVGIWGCKFGSQSACRIIVCLTSCVLCLLLYSQNSGGQDTTDAASFLKIGAGARAIALGSAFVAVADDASAVYWNPAGMTQLSGPVISLADRIPVMGTDYANPTGQTLSHSRQYFTRLPGSICPSISTLSNAATSIIIWSLHRNRLKVPSLPGRSLRPYVSSP